MEAENRGDCDLLCHISCQGTRRRQAGTFLPRARLSLSLDSCHLFLYCWLALVSVNREDSRSQLFRKWSFEFSKETHQGLPLQSHGSGRSREGLTSFSLTHLHISLERRYCCLHFNSKLSSWVLSSLSLSSGGTPYRCNIPWWEMKLSPQAVRTVLSLCDWPQDSNGFAHLHVPTDLSRTFSLYKPESIFVTWEAIFGMLAPCLSSVGLTDFAVRNEVGNVLERGFPPLHSSSHMGHSLLQRQEKP